MDVNDCFGFGELAPTFDDKEVFETGPNLGIEFASEPVADGHSFVAAVCRPGHVEPWV